MKKIIFFTVVVLIHKVGSCQFLSHDIGFHAGRASVRTDYEVSNDFFNSKSPTSLSFTYTPFRYIQVESLHAIWYPVRAI